MSQDSPYVFAKHDDNGVIHYTLSDTSGRVVCKAFLSGEALVMITADSMELRETSRGVYTPEDLEAWMRRAVR